MLLSRLSENGAKLFATTNPDSPAHWVKRDYLDNPRIDLLSIKFTLDDNVFLPKKYVESLKSEFCGVFYDRFILGNGWLPRAEFTRVFPRRTSCPPRRSRAALPKTA